MLPLLLTVAIAAAPAQKAQADRAFAQGRKLLAEGRVKEACAAFDKSNTLLPAWLSSNRGLLNPNSEAWPNRSKA